MAMLIETFVPISCGACGVVFGVPADWQRERVRDRATWFCPNGHARSFIGKTSEQELREQLAKERDLRAQTLAAFDQVVAEKHELKKDLRAVKRERNATLRRITNGECPGCGRHFTNLERHMQSKHPESVVTAAEAVREHRAH